MKRLFLFCVIDLCIVSCNSELGIEYPTAKIKSYHLIDIYQPWDYAKLETYKNLKTGAKGISVYFLDDIPCNEIVSKEYAAEWNKSSKQSYNVSTEGFDELAKKNNDEGYEWDVLVVYDLYGETAKSINCNMALERGLKSIDIVSDCDFDKDHQAGESLNDMVKFYGISYSQFLAPDMNKNNVNVKDIGLVNMEKICSELTSFDLQVLYGYFELEFKELPTLAKIHNITVSVTDVYGDIYSDTIKINF